MGVSTSAVAQPQMDEELTFCPETEREAREQIRRLMTRYDLSAWIFAKEVRILCGVEARSHPIVTLNTDYLEDDERQLSIFIHGKIHVFVGDPASKRNAVDDLRAMFPDAPNDDFRLFQHIVVGWLELDGLAEILGEKRAREVIEAKVAAAADQYPNEIHEPYEWYYRQVIDNTSRIGAVLERHRLVITPTKGLAL